MNVLQNLTNALTPPKMFDATGQKCGAAWNMMEAAKCGSIAAVRPVENSS
jgi:hypothetical protein